MKHLAVGIYDALIDEYLRDTLVQHRGRVRIKMMSGGGGWSRVWVTGVYK